MEIIFLALQSKPIHDNPTPKRVYPLRHKNSNSKKRHSATVKTTGTGQRGRKCRKGC